MHRLAKRVSKIDAETVDGQTLTFVYRDGPRKAQRDLFAPGLAILAPRTPKGLGGDHTGPVVRKSHQWKAIAA